MTNYLAVVGPLTMWPGGRSVIDAEMEENLPEVLVVEIPHSKIHWMEPKDISAEDVVLMVAEDFGEFHSNHPRGMLFVNTAQRCREFPKANRWMLKKFLTKSLRDDRP